MATQSKAKGKVARSGKQAGKSKGNNGSVVVGTPITAKQVVVTAALNAKPSAGLVAAQQAVIAYLKAQGATSAPKAVHRTKVWAVPGCTKLACLTLRSTGHVGRTTSMGLYLTGKVLKLAAVKAMPTKPAKAPTKPKAAKPAQSAN